MSTKTDRIRVSNDEHRQEAKAFILFGADEFAKARGGRFITSNPTTIEKIAKQHHLRLALVQGGDLEKIAKKMPAGRMEAVGPLRLPGIRETLYAELVGLTAGTQAQPAEPTGLQKSCPRTVADLAPGHTVLAHESEKCGWWEAIVLERSGDLFTLKYRDWPAVPPIVRHRSAVALLWPGPG